MATDIQYVSTRGRTEPMGFQDAVMTGLAPDGGLLIPDRIPQVQDRLEAWSTLSFQELSYEILRLYIDIPDRDLRGLIDRSYAAFLHPEVAPTIEVGPVHILELWHGPTLAFKDIALQFLCNFFEYTLDQLNSHMNILGATSGDTGSAAINGVRQKKRINIFMMHPYGRVAPLQERQMTTVLDDNVFNLAVKGTFDDCQNMMKAAFRDLAFKERYQLGAVNSVNWARVLAQIVYYFSAGLYVMNCKHVDRVRFAVPTGNFGDVLAGWYALQMGLPVSQLILATNENDILARFFSTGVYRCGKVVKTLSPSMDIQVASNFERYLYYRTGQDGVKLNGIMEDFERMRSLSLDLASGEKVDPAFVAGVGGRESTMNTIRRYDRDYGYVLDPHTAVGVHVGEQHCVDGEPMICLATAHPAKFGAVIFEAIGKDSRHEILDGLASIATRCEVISNNTAEVCDFIAKHA